MIPEEVEVRVGVLVAVVACGEVAVVERKISGLGKEVMIESVVLDWTTGESVRLGFCPGNVRTGI